MKRSYVDVREGQIHYRTEGDGEVILLLHMSGSSSDEFTRVIPFLSRDYGVIAIDFLGSGESDKPPRKYRIEDHARSIINVMDSLGIRKAHIVGAHTGAEVGVEMAVTFSSRVDSLVLYSIPYFRTENERTSYTERPLYDDVKIEPDGGYLMEWWKRASRYGDPPEIVNERVLDFHKAGLRGGEMHRAAHAYTLQLPSKLPPINCPTMVLSGSRDHFCPVAEDIQKLIPRSRLFIIKNAPVYVTRVMPKEFAQAVRDFLKNPMVD